MVFIVKSLVELCNYQCIKPHTEQQSDTKTAHKLQFHICVFSEDRTDECTLGAKKLRSGFEILQTSVESSYSHFHVSTIQHIFIFWCSSQQKALMKRDRNKTP